MRVTLKNGATNPHVFCDDGSEIKGLVCVDVRMGPGMWPRADLTVALRDVDVVCMLEKLYCVFNGKRYRMVELDG